MAQDNETPDTLSVLTLFDMDTVQHSGDLHPEQGQELAVTNLGTLRNDAVSGTLLSAPVSPAELFNNETSTPTREPRVFFDNFLDLLKTRRREFSLGVAALTLAGLAGGTLFLKNNEAPEPRAVAIAQPTGTPAPIATEAAAPSPTDIPTTLSSPEASAVPTPEKGSIESYQVTVKDNSTTAEAIASLGKLQTLFMMSGKFDPNTNSEKTSSVNANDNMLVAYFGENPEATHPAMVEAWRKTRVVLSRAMHFISTRTNNTGSLEYELFYTAVGNPPTPAGENDAVNVEVTLNSQSNVNTWSPTADFSNNATWKMTVAKVKNADGVLVWRVVDAENISPTTN